MRVLNNEHINIEPFISHVLDPLTAIFCAFMLLHHEGSVALYARLVGHCKNICYVSNVLIKVCLGKLYMVEV